MLLVALTVEHLHGEAAEVAEVRERPRAHRAAQLAGCGGRADDGGGARVLETRSTLSRDGTPADNQAALRRLDAVDAVWPGQPATCSIYAEVCRV